MMNKTKNNKKLNIDTYLNDFKNEYQKKSVPVKEKIENNVKNMVKSYSESQIIQLINNCQLDDSQKEKLIKGYKDNSLIFIDWAILAKLTQIDKYKDNPPSTADVLKTVGVGEMAQFIGELSEQYERKFSIEASRSILPAQIEFETIIVDGKETVDTTKGPVAEYVELLSSFKSQIAECAVRIFDDFLTDQFLGEEIETKEKISIMQSFSMNPTYLTESRSKLTEALLDFKYTDFIGKENPGFPGYETVKKEYKADYYSGFGKIRRRNQVSNALALHQKLENTAEPNFRDITEYTDIDFNSNLLNKPSNIIITPEDMEVYNGIDTCVNYYISQFPNKKFKDECKIPLTFDDIAVGMGYSKATDKLRTQIGRSLAKFEDLRCTNFWHDELEARGLLNKVEELIDMYGDVVSVTNVAPRLLSFDYIWITKNKAPKRKSSKNNSAQFDGKPGIIINQFPPLTAYNLITNQIIYIPIEWINIPKTGTSKEMKRIKRYLCKRIQTLIYFQDIEENKGKYDKRSFDPNRGNFNKIVLDNLLSEVGGYDLTIQESFPVKDIDGNIMKNQSGRPIMRPATPEEINKQNKSILTKRKIHIDQILNYLKKLKEIVPKIKEIKIETKEGRDYSLRIIVE